MQKAQIHPANSGEQLLDLFQDWYMIVAGIHQTFGFIDLKTMRAKDFLNIYLPNMSKDTTLMEIVRIRATPNNKLSPEERKVKSKHRIKSENKQDVTGFINILSSLAKGSEKNV